MKNKSVVLVFIFLLLLSSCGSPSSSSSSKIEIQNAWVRAATAGMGAQNTMQPGNEHMEAGMGFNSAAYLTLVNNGKEADRLVSARSPVAKVVELHKSEMKGEIMSMTPVDFVEIAAGGQAELKPGGFHVMLIDLKEDLIPGNRVELTLVFEKSGEITIQAEVRAP